MTPTSFDGLGLAEPLRLALKTENYLKPTPIQAQAIPLLVEGRDLLGIAQTGTGKTAAFALPILHRLAEQRRPRTPGRPHALILAPTRELARQIDDRFRAYGRKLQLRSAVIFGGVGQGQQVKALQQGVDILIATPGRLLDLYAQRHVNFDQVSILVLDEADRMLDMGFIRDVRKIVAACRKERQTLLFSATMPPDIAKLAAEILRNPARIDVSPATVDRGSHRSACVLRSGAGEARPAGGAARRSGHGSRARLHAHQAWCRQGLQVSAGSPDLPVEAIHGNKAQNARVRALDAFRSGQARVLVATDIAARGIDVPGISHVINYELPNEPESYVHRIGRTARAGAGGTALSFCDSSERAYLRDIEKLTRVSLSRGGPSSLPRPKGSKPPRIETASSNTASNKTTANRWRPERQAAAPAAKQSWRSNGRRGNALPAARGALARPRSARVSLTGESR